MHTAICAFDDRAAAERARDRLLQAGFAREDIHLQHRGADRDAGTRGEDPRVWSGSEHEIALDRHVVEAVTGFFGRVFGPDHPHTDTYAGHVGGGRTVVVVDAHDEAEARRAHDLLHALQGDALSVVHRPDQRPLREITALRGGEAPVTAATPAGGRRDAGWTERTAERDTASERGEAQRERALAAGSLGEQRPLDLRDPDNDKVGLRYADQERGRKDE